MSSTICKLVRKVYSNFFKADYFFTFEIVDYLVHFGKMGKAEIWKNNVHEFIKLK